jgi:hypothetical protein
LVVSIASFWGTYQMTIKQMRSSTFSEIMSRLFAINELEVEKPVLFELLYNDFEAIKDGKDKIELTNYVFMIFNLYLEIYTQHERFKLFDNEQMNAWEARITNDLTNRRFLRGYWKSEMALYSNEYTKSFKKFIAKAIERAEMADASRFQSTQADAP